GSCFTFEFSIPEVSPDQLCYQMPIAQNIKPNAQQVIPGLQGRVLIAEDNQDTQNLVKLYIKKTGAEAVFANDGQQAVEKALAEDFDLVLMDIQMPIMNGIEATQMLRQVGFQPPIIAFTANVIKADLDTYLDAGCNGHISKPINTSEFFSVLAKYLHPDDMPNPNRLKTNMLDDDEFAAIRTSYLAGMTKFMAALDEAAQQQDLQQVKVMIHTLKGAAGSLAFNSLYTLAKDIEQQFKADNCASLAQQIERLRECIQLVRLEEENNE
ncbi:MAG: CheY-like chemotaxis protein, partial [Phenylobacterium sp.]